MVKDILRHRAFDIRNHHCAFGFLHGAHSFTEPFGRANSPADFRHGAFLQHQAGRTIHITTTQKSHPLRHTVALRTDRGASTASQAARALPDSLPNIERPSDFFVTDETLSDRHDFDSTSRWHRNRLDKRRRRQKRKTHRP